MNIEENCFRGVSIFEDDNSLNQFDNIIEEKDLNSIFPENSKIPNFDEESQNENEETSANSNNKKEKLNNKPLTNNIAKDVNINETEEKTVEKTVNTNENKVIYLRIKNGRLEYLFKKMLTIISKILIKTLNENNSNSFKRINLKLKITYEELKFYLGANIEELLKKNDKNISLIESKEQLPDECKNILDMNFHNFIIINKNEINKHYTEYFQKFIVKYRNAESFEEYNSIDALIKKILKTKGNNTKSNNQEKD
jgi:hypothetical protein